MTAQEHVHELCSGGDVAQPDHAHVEDPWKEALITERVGSDPPGRVLAEEPGGVSVEHAAVAVDRGAERVAVQDCYPAEAEPVLQGVHKTRPELRKIGGRSSTTTGMVRPTARA